MSLARLDHLVVAASSLDEGARWCEETLGVAPLGGGQHPLMGTHNRLLRIDAPGFPKAYLEIIAIDPEAPAPQRKRWFDMDDPLMQDNLRTRGPRLVHWVARCEDAQSAAQALRGLGIDRGPLLDAQRQTSSGLLQWRISVRDDGQRLFDGVLPTLIEWKETHPVDNMPRSEVSLRSLCASHPEARTLHEAFAAIEWADVELLEGAPRMIAHVDTPKGRVAISSLAAGNP